MCLSLIRGGISTLVPESVLVGTHIYLCRFLYVNRGLVPEGLIVLPVVPAVQAVAVHAGMGSLWLGVRIHCTRNTLPQRLCNVSGPGFVASWHHPVTPLAGPAEPASAVPYSVVSPQGRRFSFRGIGTWPPALYT